MLVQIIHPDTYKSQGDTLCMGHIPEYEERDLRVLSFLEAALEARVGVLFHERTEANPISTMMMKIVLKTDPIYRILDDDRIKRVSTFRSGLPLPKNGSERVDTQTWEYLLRHFTTHQEMARAIESPRQVLFIGGLLEACLTNMACYHHDHYKPTGQDQELLYCPELCVMGSDEVFQTIARPELERRGIRAVGYDEAMRLVRSRAEELLPESAS